MPAVPTVQEENDGEILRVISARKATKEETRLKAELAALEALPDDAIDVSDIPEVTDWRDAVRGRFYRPVKKAISRRVDVAVLAWFRSLGDKHQSRMNEALREYLRPHHKQASVPHPGQ